jgi:hypothetical protein
MVSVNRVSTGRIGPERVDRIIHLQLKSNFYKIVGEEGVLICKIDARSDSTGLVETGGTIVPDKVSPPAKVSHLNRIFASEQSHLHCYE